MTQLQTQKDEYWDPSNFALTESDIEQIYNYFIELEKPQTIDEITQAVIRHRIAEEKSKLKPRLEGRIIYQPKKSVEVGAKLVFPALSFAHGEVTEVRTGTNPSYGTFSVAQVTLEDGKVKEFASELEIEHPLNDEDGMAVVKMDDPDPDELYERFGAELAEKIQGQLQEHADFVRLADEWFVKALLLDINIGHLHLSEAVLEMNEGGPLPTAEIRVHLDLDPAISESVQEFSLNYGLLEDKRFDEVAPPGQVMWFLRRLEPEPIQNPPGRLRLNEPSYDRALLSNQALQIEREIDDEWSDLPAATVAREITVALTYPHRWAGTIPLSARTRPLFPLGVSSRQIITFIDEETGEEISGWVVAEHRFVYGLSDWYRRQKIPIGGFIHLIPAEEPGTVYISYDSRPKPRREWVRLATINDGKISFNLEKRAIGCNYDDLMIVGTDSVAALDALFQSTSVQQRSLGSLLAEMMPSLAEPNPQQSVHAKTLYSAVNMLRRVTPGAILAELTRHPAFVSVGDQYWQFDRQRWQS